MTKFIDKLPKIVLYVLMGLSIVLGVLFFAGGNSGSLEVAGDFLNIPRFTDLFLNWNYILIGAAVFITLICIVITFAQLFKNTPKKALRSLGFMCLFVLVFVVSWFLGSPEEMKIIGYEGTDNVGFWAQCTDMIIYSVYVLIGAVVLTIIGGAIYVKIKK